MKVLRAIFRLAVVLTFLLVAIALLADPASAQISVTATTPSSTAQGTVNLNVTISGSGFKKGAKAHWFVSGTTNPGGVTVNSTAFSGSNTLVANITVAADATISGYDVQVMNTDGRTGVGTELFSVQSSSGNQVQCGTPGAPSGWTQTSQLNTGQYTAGGLGTAVRVRLISTTDSTGQAVQYYAGLAGSGSGSQSVLFTMSLSGVITSSAVVSNSAQARDMAVGDVDGDGVPDFVIGSTGSKAVILFGQMNGTTYSINSSRTVTLTAPTSSAGFGVSVAVGDLNGDGIAEIAVGANGGSNGGKKYPGKVFVYRYSTSSNSVPNTPISTINDPSGQSTSQFGNSVAIGNFSGTPYLVVGAPAGNNSAGVVWAINNPLVNGTAVAYQLTVASTQQLGYKVGVGDVNGDGIPDVVAITNGLNSSTAPQSGAIFAGPFTANVASPSATLLPQTGLAQGWGTSFDVVDVDGDGKADILVGAPNTTYGSPCTTSVGTAYLFLGSSLQWSGSANAATAIFGPPAVTSEFGYGIGGAPAAALTATPIIAVGEIGWNTSTTSAAGQVWIYQKN